jgi:hypothetical protein
LENSTPAIGTARPAVIQMPKFTLPKSYPALPPSASEPPTTNQFSRLFTQAELELLPNSHPLDRKTLKKAAKRSAKAAREAEIREREADADMFDAASMFGSMSVAVPKRPEKKKAKAKPAQAKTTRGTLPSVTIDAETQKELDFANFLNSVGGKLLRERRLIFLMLMRGFFDFTTTCSGRGGYGSLDFAIQLINCFRLYSINSIHGHDLP